MDAISYSKAAQQEQRIKKFVAEPDSVAGLVSVPNLVPTGETITIPAGRTVVHPNLQVAGTLTVDGTLFIPSGGTYSATEVDATVVKQNGNVVANDNTVVHKTGDETIAGIKSFSGGVKVQNQNVTPFSGFKNYIINGGFDIWQRGTSFSASSEYTADRWRVQIGGDAGTKNRSTDVPTGYKYSLNLTMTGLASHSQTGQQIEFVNFKGLLGKTATLSFWVKANNTNITTMTYRIRHSTNLEDEAILFAGPTLVSGSKTVSTTWQQHTASFVVPIGVKSMSIEFITGTVSNGDIFYITGVQLEEGSVATPFEQRPYGLELSLCKRYYQAYLSSNIIQSERTFHTRCTSTGTQIFTFDNIQFPEMRITPSISLSCLNGTITRVPGVSNNGVVETDWSVYIRNPNSFFIYKTVTTVAEAIVAFDAILSAEL